MLFEQPTLYEAMAVDNFKYGPWYTVTSGSTGWISKYTEALAKRPQVMACPSDPTEPYCNVYNNVIVGMSHTYISTGKAATGIQFARTK